MNSLKSFLRQQAHLSGIQQLLSWDQETMMPKGAIQSRAEQGAILAELAHERIVSQAFRDLLSQHIDFETGVLSASVPESEKRLIELIYKDWKVATALPAEWVSEWSHLTATAQHQWEKAREQNDFSLFAPYLEKLIKMTRKKASYINPNLPTYDVLLDQYEPGMTAAQLKPLFHNLRDGIIDILGTLTPHTPTVSTGPYDLQKQESFTLDILAAMGFDFNHGRQDLSTHPFTTNFHPTDVRLTTRLKDHDLLEAISGSIHEGGHGLYEQGLDPEWFGTPYGESCSLGIHESQSRLWENMIGRSEAFWRHYLPILQSLYPEHLKDCSLDAFLADINTVQPGPIRVAADEVTYNLHIMIRFEIEAALFNDNLNVSDLPSLWNQKYQDYLGITPEDNANGILQDVHWSAGLFGYFPTYTLGNLYSAQLWETLQKDIPQLTTKIASGNFQEITQWLNQHIFSHGRKWDPIPLMAQATGQPFSEKPFLNYLTQKYKR